MRARQEDFTVGWICAIEIEFVVACELLDKEYLRTERPTVSQQDPNSYHFGRIHDHNVVIACLPKGQYGNNSATFVASHMLHSFPAIRIGLMVGIGGGAPSHDHDIRLGDVVVSSPTPRHGGVIQYDYGKTIQSRQFEETGYLTLPPQLLLNALSYLNTQHMRKGHKIESTISNMLAKNKRLRAKYGRPPATGDQLFHADVVHAGAPDFCYCMTANTKEKSESKQSLLIQREERNPDEDNPVIHYGLIASANSLMKDAEIRDQLIGKHDVLCFEMEAAGLINSFPCVVVRGISDYSDTHKSDEWQGYAAATAAAYAKELLEVLPAAEIKKAHPAKDSEEAATQSHQGVPQKDTRDDQNVFDRHPGQDNANEAHEDSLTHSIDQRSGIASPDGDHEMEEVSAALLSDDTDQEYQRRDGKIRYDSLMDESLLAARQLDRPLVNKVVPTQTPKLDFEDAQKYLDLFHKAKGSLSYTLHRHVCLELWRPCQLPAQVLGKVWELLDVDNRGLIYAYDFVLAIHLIVSLWFGTMSRLPDTLPDNAYANVLELEFGRPQPPQTKPVGASLLTYPVKFNTIHAVLQRDEAARASFRATFFLHERDFRMWEENWLSHVRWNRDKPSRKVVDTI